ncbi:MAG TPA: glycoside hydrolase family 27 protein [Chitinophagaceae bacterium]|nr:glycoside hydrolase family 27 protein [Chitinophagaceae bacterium]
MKNYLIILCCLFFISHVKAQEKKLAPTPPMGWMSWNYFADKINEKDLKEMADALVSSGMAKVGYSHIFIDDGWQGGRDNKNNMIADPLKFPSGMKALADYMHSKGLKLGIYSDAAQLTCAGYTASLGFEEQDAKTFAGWGIDYLKYDYCHAPEDVETAKDRYKKMATALRNSGRDIVFGICEWGPRQPWLWGADVGGQLWRTTYDVRDKWKNLTNNKNALGILDILDINATLNDYSGPGKWNDADMLVAGLYGKKGPSGDEGGFGCTDVEYQTQFSLWAMMNSPLYATNDLRNMNEATKKILLNEEVIAINQDEIGKQAIRKINDSIWNVFVKPLSNGDFALAILNRSNAAQKSEVNFADLGINDKYEIRDLWQYKIIGKAKKWKGEVQSHETKMFRLKKQK